MSEEKLFSLVYCRGVEGNSVYLNDYRIAGPKPWGGGEIIKEWSVRIEDILNAIPHLKNELSLRDQQIELSKNLAN